MQKGPLPHSGNRGHSAGVARAASGGFPPVSLSFLHLCKAVVTTLHGGTGVGSKDIHQPEELEQQLCSTAATQTPV